MNTLLKILFLLSFFSVSNGFGQSNLMFLEGYAQGTSYHITYYDAKKRNFQDEINDLLVELDESVSTYQPNSIISKINKNDNKVKVDRYFEACFIKAKEIYRSTNGAFDPTVYPLVNIWGFGPEKKSKIERFKIDSVLAFVGFDLINLKREKIIKKDPRVSLDFNAFAQGYSVDIVSYFLKKNGITSFIVEIGGEVFAQGLQENGENWLIGIEQPFDNKETGNPLKAIIRLDGLAVATSGNYRRFFIEDGIKYVHHIDPKTGYPTKNNLLSATVISKECITSDATATGLLVMGTEKAKSYLSEHPELEAYLIYSDEKGNFQVYQTKGMTNLIIEEE